MLSILATTGRLVASRWPHLLAWYLAGYLVHYVVIQIAGFVGATSALAGIAIMPLAIVARLASFIGMFFVLRHAMPAFQSLQDKGQDATDVPAPTPARQRMTEVLLIAILPFFAFYAAWQFLRDDTQAYAQVALANVDFGNEAEGNVLDLQVTPLTVGVIVLAFAVRFAIKKFEAKLPRWSKLIAVYFEALWVYLVILVLSDYINMAVEWINSRAAVQWLNEARDWAMDVVAPLGWLWSGIETVVGQLGELVLLPLAWLTIAGVVYGRALAQASFRLRYLERFRPRVSRLPKGLVNRLKELGNDVASRFRPIANAAVLIWRAGFVPVTFFVFAYIALEALMYWLLMGLVRVIGPHELGWWFNVDDMVFFVAQLLIEPLRIALIAAAYDYCLRRLEQRRDAAANVAATPAVAGTAAGTP